MGFCLIHVVSYILYCWHTPFFQPDWNAEQGQWPFIYVTLLAKVWITALVGFSSVLLSFD